MRERERERESFHPKPETLNPNPWTAGELFASSRDSVVPDHSHTHTLSLSHTHTGTRSLSLTLSLCRGAFCEFARRRGPRPPLHRQLCTCAGERLGRRGEGEGEGESEEMRPPNPNMPAAQTVVAGEGGGVQSARGGGGDPKP